MKGKKWKYTIDWYKLPANYTILLTSKPSGQEHGHLEFRAWTSHDPANTSLQPLTVFAQVHPLSQVHGLMNNITDPVR